MAHRLAAVHDQRHGGTRTPPHDGTGRVVTVLLLVAALAALAEVAASRTTRLTEAPLRSSSWEAGLEVADAALLRGDAPAARHAYLIALSRARAERSLPGLVRAAEGLAALGDDALVAEALEMAAQLHAADTEAGALARLQALRAHRDAPAPLPAANRPTR
jgi:hypothetical protein